MQIELPALSWTLAPRAHDDAQTLTLPAQHGLSLASQLAAAVGEPGTPVRCEVPAAPSPTLTLTL
jgi:hypothetical protein